MNTCLRSLAFIAFTMISVSIGLAQEKKPKGDIQTELQKLVEEHKAIGLAVAVVQDNKLVYSNSIGFRDREANAPLKDHDLFRIASISKSFSATSVMQLVEAGKVSLDAEVSELIGFPVKNPKFPEEKITLKMLLSHTSSINDSQGYFELSTIDPSKSETTDKCYNDYRPGTGYQYCNLNFNMVGAIIERISGERFDKYIAKHILEPLGVQGGFNLYDLDRSRFVTLYEYDTANETFSPQPRAYSLRQELLDNYTFGYSTPIFSPTGGLKISAIDLSKVMNMHMAMGELNGVRIISPESAATMQSIVSEKGKYGLALMTKTDLIPGETLKGHTGSAYGLYSMMFFNPEKKYGFVAVTNGSLPKQDSGNHGLLQRTIRALHAHCIE